jgi:hypothetical protein
MKRSSSNGTRVLLAAVPADEELSHLAVANLAQGILVRSAACFVHHGVGRGGGR